MNLHIKKTDISILNNLSIIRKITKTAITELHFKSNNNCESHNHAISTKNSELLE